MNRKETKLLVENWRKVLNEGLNDHEFEILNESLILKEIGLYDQEILNEGPLMKQISSLASKAMILVALSGGIANAELPSENAQKLAQSEITAYAGLHHHTGTGSNENTFTNSEENGLIAFGQAAEDASKVMGMDDKAYKAYLEGCLKKVNQSVENGENRPEQALGDLTGHLKNLARKAQGKVKDIKNKIKNGGKKFERKVTQYTRGGDRDTLETMKKMKQYMDASNQK